MKSYTHKDRIGSLEAVGIACELVDELPDVTKKIYFLPVETKDRLGRKKVVYEEWMFQKHKIGYFTGLKPEEENLLCEEVDRNPSVVKGDDSEDLDYCNDDCEHCEWVPCPKETFRKVFEVDDDVPVIIKVPSEGSDES